MKVLSLFKDRLRAASRRILLFFVHMFLAKGSAFDGSARGGNFQGGRSDKGAASLEEKPGVSIAPFPGRFEESKYALPDFSGYRIGNVDEYIRRQANGANAYFPLSGSIERCRFHQDDEVYEDASQTFSRETVPKFTAGGVNVTDNDDRVRELEDENESLKQKLVEMTERMEKIGRNVRCAISHYQDFVACARANDESAAVKFQGARTSLLVALHNVVHESGSDDSHQSF